MPGASWSSPGFIDPHVHIYLPFMSTFAKDTHETGSIAALIGGHNDNSSEMWLPRTATTTRLQGYRALEIESGKEERVATTPFPHVGLPSLSKRRPGQFAPGGWRTGLLSFKDFSLVQEFLWRDG